MSEEMAAEAAAEGTVTDTSAAEVPADTGVEVAQEGQAEQAEQAAEPSADGSAEPEQLTREQVEQFIQQRMAQQQPAEPPSYMRDLMESQRQQTEVFTRLLQQAQAQTQRQRVEASRPRPPSRDAPIEEHLKWQQADYQWQLEQAQSRTQGTMLDHIGKLEATIKDIAGRMEAERTHAQQRAQEYEQQRYLESLSSKPEFSWIKDDDRRAALNVIHQAIVRNGAQASLADTAKLVAKAFGLNGPSAQAKNSAQRLASTEALKQQRAAVRGRAGPLPSSTTTSRTSAPPTDRVNAARKALAAGAKLPPEMLAFYGLNKAEH